MASHPELKVQAQARLKTAKILLDAEDWEACAYMMAMSLELALKSVICNTLNLADYPDVPNDNLRDVNYFLTHKFDQLLTLSGMTDIFLLPGLEIPSAHWNLFRQSYPNNYPDMRYPNKSSQYIFDHETVPKLHEALVTHSESIINTIESKSRW